MPQSADTHDTQASERKSPPSARVRTEEAKFQSIAMLEPTWRACVLTEATRGSVEERNNNKHERPKKT
jgi:hypothetical protein